MKFSYFHTIKPSIDLMLSVFALLLLSPLLLVVTVLIKLESKGPVFYSQDRLGKNGRIIRLLKFRSMTHRPERKPGEGGEIIGDNSEVTIVGKYIRRFKIDELPQIINVISGDLSFIGPRPSLPELIKKFDFYGKKRLSVRPGCSGLAQIHGNIHLSWPERWKYDAFYVDHLSFKLDLKIFYTTLLIIFFGEDRFIVPFHEFIQRQ